MLSDYSRAMTRFLPLWRPVTMVGRIAAILLLMVALALMSWHAAAAAEAFRAPAAEVVLKTVKPEHPRLLVSPHGPPKSFNRDGGFNKAGILPGKTGDTRQ